MERGGERGGGEREGESTLEGNTGCGGGERGATYEVPQLVLAPHHCC